ncbi:MAG TPA: hypothetical protein PKI14_15370 [Fervidobacterium sp.]|nr:hypothetical protein [Fervidobacterium sp.]
MIENMSPRSGRVLREDDSYINVADLFPGVVSGKAIGSGTAEFSAGSANSRREVVITPEGNIKTSLRLEVKNPSTESDLTIEIYETINDVEYFVNWYTIPRKATRTNGKTVEAHARLLPILGCGEAIKIAVSNDQAVITPFSVNVVIREV